MNFARIRLNHAALRSLDAAAVRALEMTGEAIHTEMVQAQAIPFRTGHLQNDSTFVDFSHSAQGQVDIVSSTPYARRLYYHPEFDFYKDENPNAQGRWFEPWAEGGEHEDFAQKAFAELYRREAGL